MIGKSNSNTDTYASIRGKLLRIRMLENAPNQTSNLRVGSSNLSERAKVAKVSAPDDYR